MLVAERRWKMWELISRNCGKANLDGAYISRGLKYVVDTRSSFVDSGTFILRQTQLGQIRPDHFIIVMKR
jgi:hypothetical protein